MHVAPRSKTVEPDIEDVPRQGLSVRDDSLIDDHVIGKSDIKRTLQEVRDGVKDERFGIFGPGSVMWQILEPVVVLPFMLMNAGLMEGLHPKVIFGTQDSKSLQDFGPRYARSYDAFSDWFTGDVDAAIKTARRIHGYHSRIGGPAPESAGAIKKGDEFAASEEDLMLWNMATMVIPLKYGYERLVRTLTPAENERYWNECRDFAKLFGISDEVLPDSWDGLLNYMDDYAASGQLEITAMNLSGGFMFDQSEIKLPNRWFVQIYFSMQFHMLPDSYRAFYEPQAALARDKGRRLSTFGWSAARVLMRVLPKTVTTMPRLSMAKRRAGAGPDAGRFETWWISKLPHPFGTKTPSLGIPSNPEADPAKSDSFKRVPKP